MKLSVLLPTDFLGVRSRKLVFKLYAFLSSPHEFEMGSWLYQYSRCLLCEEVGDDSDLPVLLKFFMLL